MSANHVSRATKANASGSVSFFEPISTRRIRDERELRRDLGIGRKTRSANVNDTKFLRVTGEISMLKNENSALLNELITVEELEEKIAPSGLADVLE